MTQGKCPLEMRRTTSMSHFRNPPPRHGQEEEEEEVAPVSNFPPTTPSPPPASYGYGYAPPLGNPSSPQEGNRTLPLPPVGFLEACFFCKRRLGQSRDIFIYRGDRAFCSVECRHQQIVVDERKEKLSASTAPENKPSATTTSAHPNLPATVPLPTGTRAAA